MFRRHLEAQNVPLVNGKSVTKSGNISYGTGARPAQSSGRAKCQAFCKRSRVRAGLGPYPGNARKNPIPAQFLQKKERRGLPRRPDASGQRPYAHFGSPSLLAGANEVVPTYTAHVLVVVVCDTVAVKPLAVTAMVGPTTPLVVAYAVPRLLVYFTESARYAFSFVFANFGIAIAAKMPMITTTIRSSISVKPLRFI